MVIMNTNINSDMYKLCLLYSLHDFVRELEAELCLLDYTRSQRLVLSVVASLHEALGSARSSVILDKCLQHGLSRPTVFRKLIVLTQSKKIFKDRKGFYKLQ